MRKSNKQSLKEALENYVETFRLKPKLTEVNIVNAWEELMGAPIANRTKKLTVSGKTLIIELNSSVLREELAFAKAKIVEKINERAGYEFITEVVLR